MSLKSVTVIEFRAIFLPENHFKISKQKLRYRQVTVRLENHSTTLLSWLVSICLLNFFWISEIMFKAYCHSSPTVRNDLSNINLRYIWNTNNEYKMYSGTTHQNVRDKHSVRNIFILSKKWQCACTYIT